MLEGRSPSPFPLPSREGETKGTVHLAGMVNLSIRPSREGGTKGTVRLRATKPSVFIPSREGETRGTEAFCRGLEE